jgi:hypothetical protein
MGSSDVAPAPTSPGSGFEGLRVLVTGGASGIGDGGLTGLQARREAAPATAGSEEGVR